MEIERELTDALGTDAREQFEREGFLVVETTGVDQKLLDAIVDDLDPLYGGPHRKENGVVYYPNRVQDAWKISENVKALARSPMVASILENLYGRTPLPFQTINFRRGSEQAAHSDALHFSSLPEGYMCGVWVALEDIDMDNGPLVYYPGSQKLPMVSMTDVGVEAAKVEYSHYERHIADLIEREGLEPRHGTIAKGQALVWAANLLHGGAEQRDRGRTRHSQVTHFFFEGCRYYTPMLSKGDEIRWRNPEWIA
jgi:ectoine hydroxylase-related dioxygenase (phytanoyl-CoA dioxygenase family)